MTATTAHRSQDSPAATFTRIAFHLAPVLMLTYGLVRLIDGRDGHHGPGTAWTVGHLLFLGALLMYGPVIVGLRRRVPRGGMPRRLTANIATGVALVGLATFIRVAIIDIVVGLQAADPAEKSRLSDRYSDVPAVLPQVVYEIGPMFFMLGLIVLLVQLAVVGPRSIGNILSPVLVVLGFITIFINLDLLSAGAALIWLALIHHARTPARAETRRRTPQPNTA
ncbi:hypothetical protein [Actinomadura rudentiformis]|uniref:Uncharacterized protein n=1 Tax=Actinomadura rudentiformis TaxID=359158 RepID=A0A6H9YTU1_9ACTN|nr:hypothetical protein [Actinomadura rudentiformis]KAB2344728.1 hypothetical protein F8566_29395 [Actinomadura rudentiformis]